MCIYIYIYVVVQFCPWCKFYFPLFKTHYHTLSYITIPPKQRKIKFAPRTKLHHNFYIYTALLTPLQKLPYTTLYTPTLHCTPIYSTIHHYTALYTFIRYCTPQYNTVHPYIALFTPIQHCLPLYSTVHPYTPGVSNGTKKQYAISKWKMHF